MINTDTKSTRRVRACLAGRGLEDRLLALTETSRSAKEAAAALGVEVGAIVKTLIFTITDKTGDVMQPVAALVSGDRQCIVDKLPMLAAIDGNPKRPDADYVKAVTGYSIGAVSPIGLGDDITILIDTGLARFPRVWAAAGHTHLVVGLGFDELVALTSGVPTDDLAV